MLPSLTIDPRIVAGAPDMQIGFLRCRVVNSTTSDSLWSLINAEAEAISARYPAPLDINQRSAIAATRALYKAVGKDPNRYRGSAEAMCRRIVRGLGLYRINTLVDIVNLFSIHSGYAIGGFDADKIAGMELTLGVGREGEPFEGIGRGPLNIEGMPVYRDAVGGIGTPTSDNERTKMGLSTTHIHLNINAFGPEMPLPEMLEWCRKLLQQFASATEFETAIITP